MNSARSLLCVVFFNLPIINHFRYSCNIRDLCKLQCPRRCRWPVIEQGCSGCTTRTEYWIFTAFDTILKHQVYYQSWGICTTHLPEFVVVWRASANASYGHQFITNFSFQLGVFVKYLLLVVLVFKDFAVKFLQQANEVAQAKLRDTWRDNTHSEICSGDFRNHYTLALLNL